MTEPMNPIVSAVNDPDTGESIPDDGTQVIGASVIDTSAGDVEVDEPSSTDTAGAEDVETALSGMDDSMVADPSAGRLNDNESAGGRLAQLEREGEVAADFLERLLDIADLDGDLDVDIEGDRAAVAIVDSEEGRVPRRLVGPEGRVLDALQELTRLAVQTATGERTRLMLDIAGYRADRRVALVELARQVIAEVRESGTAKPLGNMTAFERKVVHDEVTAAGLHSESEGVEPHRHIVISPA